MALGNKKSVLVKGFFIFAALSAAVMTGILLWTTDPKSWSHFREFRLVIIPVILGLGVLRWVLDGAIFTSLTSGGGGKRVGIGRAAVIRLEGNLISIILPVFIGMFTMHAYLLHREEMDWGESMAVSAIRAILPILMFVLVIPVQALMKLGLNSGSSFERLMAAISIPVLAAAVIVAFALFFPDRIKRAASWLLRAWTKVAKAQPGKIAAIEAKLAGEIDQFSRIFRLTVKEKPGRLAAASGWVFATFLADALIAIAVLWGFGFQPPLLKALAVQFLIWPLVYLAPTPGSMGVMELSYLGFYSLFMPKPMTGLAILIVRLVTMYIPMIAGVWLLAREFRGDERLKKMVLEQRMSGPET
jgi:uncharacterized protein (TIRG00374 family)